MDYLSIPSNYEDVDEGRGTAKKRKIRHVRVKTGCRDCRTRRIKCPEGILVTEGVKLPCEKCDETGTPCWYPAPDDAGRSTTRWVRAAVMDKDGKVMTSAGSLEVTRGEDGGAQPAFPDQSSRLNPIRQNSYEQAPMPSFQEVKQERPPTPIKQYFSRQPPLPHSAFPEIPTTGQSSHLSHQGPIVFAESALRNSTPMLSLPLASGAHTYLQQPLKIRPKGAKPSLRADEIPKGIETQQDIEGLQWQSGFEIGNDRGPNNYPYPFAPLPYDAQGTSSQSPFTSISSHSTMAMDPITYLLHSRMSVAERDTAPGRFRLQLTRMPWTKRIPTHRDYTRSRAPWDPQLEAGSAAVSPISLTDNLHRYFANVNQITRPLQLFTLASLLTSPLERMAVSYFETQGCGEIIATGVMKSNWIYAQMIPRVYELLAGDTEGSGFYPDREKGLEGVGSKSGATPSLLMETARCGSRQLIKEYVYHSLVRLSCVHYANMENDPTRVEALRREVRVHEKQAMKAGFTARVYFLEAEWKTEDYLMGTFIGYIADMLDSRTFQVDLELMKTDANHTFSAFETTLRDMIAVYHTLLKAFAPHDPLVAVSEGAEEALTLATCESEAGSMTVPRVSKNAVAHESVTNRTRPYSAPGPTSASAKLSKSEAVAAATSGSAIARVPMCGFKEDWVESFFGLTRDMILRIAQVNGIVAHRAALLRSGREGSEAGQALRQSAERMVEELGGIKKALDRKSEKALGLAGSLEQSETATGKSSRIRRGTSVTRLALLIIVMCELLQVDLEDPRLVQAKETALEMVADSKLSEMAGFSWALTVAAIYTRSSTQRNRITSLLRTTETWSFGVGYGHVTQEIMETCWDVMDTEGEYRYGIAPWREAMAVSGRSMYL